jgi:hypothetical protein
MKSWIDFTPNYLTEDEQQSLLAIIRTLKCTPETGQCGPNGIPSHDTIHFGPRQAYLTCVPAEFRVQTAGPIPDFLKPLHTRLENRYCRAFNSIQVQRHYNENSYVLPHSDSIHGDIPMLSLGWPRRFVLTYKRSDKSKLQRWKAGDIYFDQELPSGSLLTLLRSHQFDLNHQMPKANHPCNVRVSLIWRYIAQPVTQSIGRYSLMNGYREYRDAQRAWVAESAS